jgi:phosphosulfolactate synthase (CoM biosynthesis protein A)
MVDLMEMKEFLPPWLEWRRKQERKGLLECLKEAGKGAGGLSNREARTVRTATQKLLSSLQIPNLIFQASKIPQKFVSIEEIMGNPFCLNQEEKLW